MTPFKQHDALPRILTERQHLAISECLAELGEKLRISAVLLVDSAGRVVSHKVQTAGQFDLTLLSALTANTYAAAKELARVLGEPDNFKMVLHEGNKYHTFVANVERNFFLVVVFEPGVALGMVRLFMKKTIAQLSPILTKIEEEDGAIGQIIDDRFEALLEEELDRTFKEHS